MTDTTPAFDATLLDIIRCPVAVHYKDKGPDPGKLELVKDCWLVCADSGYKYPIHHLHFASKLLFFGIVFLLGSFFVYMFASNSASSNAFLILIFLL